MQARTYRNRGCGTWASPRTQSTFPCGALREYDAYIKTALSFPDRQVCGPSFRGPVRAQRRIGHARFASMPNACLGLVAAARPCACCHGQADAHRPCFVSTVAILDPKQRPRITSVMGDMFVRAAPPEPEAPQAARIHAAMLHHAKVRAIAAMPTDYCELLSPMDNTRTRARMPGHQ
jgi:hypothetical protein